MEVSEAKNTTNLVDFVFPLRIDEVDVKDTEEELQLDWRLRNFSLEKKALNCNERRRRSVTSASNLSMEI